MELVVCVVLAKLFVPLELVLFSMVINQHLFLLLQPDRALGSANHSNLVSQVAHVVNPEPSDGRISWVRTFVAVVERASIGPVWLLGESWVIQALLDVVSEHQVGESHARYQICYFASIDFEHLFELLRVGTHRMGQVVVHDHVVQNAAQWVDIVFVTNDHSVNTIQSLWTEQRRVADDQRCLRLWFHQPARWILFLIAIHCWAEVN